MSSTNGLTKAQVASAQLEGEYSIKSETAQPKLDTSQWPLLLKNYDKLLVRSAHFTPIPSGCSPLKRDIQSYVKCVLHAGVELFLRNMELIFPTGLELSTWTSLRILRHTKWWLGCEGFSEWKRLDTAVPSTPKLLVA